MKIHTPEWAKHAVFYQIFPDRFAKGKRPQEELGIHFKPWGSDPNEQGYHGGDLYGIIDKLDYLYSLGINALYLNPIFASASNHRYHTYDYFQVDPLLGGNKALRALLDQAHTRGIKVVLDGVFNHASRGFWAFHHILENGGESPYVDWFIIHDWPLRPYHSDDHNPPNYAAWWGLPALPKFNTQNPGVRRYLLDVAKYWVEFGIDGWRLDVPAEIDDDDFWRAFRDIVKSANPQAYICGEVWGRADRWLQGDMFDSTMNYIFCSATLSYFGHHQLRTEYQKNELPIRSITSKAFRETIDQMHEAYDWSINHCQLNLLGSHDMARPLWILGDNKRALRQAILFQMTMPGAPCIYYGDEVGVTGEDDPDCRRSFPWHDLDAIDLELQSFVRRAIELRHKHPVFRTGNFEFIETDEDKLLVFKRELGPDKALIIFNRTHKPHRIEIEKNGYSVAWGEDSWLLADDSGENMTWKIPARECLILIE